MKWIRVEWIHSNSGYPTILYSELDDGQWEIRKVEVYSDGRYGYANETNASGDTRLGLEPLPAFDEIVADPQFRLSELSREEMEAIWSLAVGSQNLCNENEYHNMVTTENAFGDDIVMQWLRFSIRDLIASLTLVSIGLGTMLSGPKLHLPDLAVAYAYFVAFILIGAGIMQPFHRAIEGATIGAVLAFCNMVVGLFHLW